MIFARPHLATAPSGSAGVLSQEQSVGCPVVERMPLHSCRCKTINLVAAIRNSFARGRWGWVMLGMHETGNARVGQGARIKTAEPKRGGLVRLMCPPERRSGCRPIYSGAKGANLARRAEFVWRQLAP